jgi:predicted dehydrogenase
MSNKEIGFGVIGCGVIAPFHIEGIQSSQGGKLIAVCDDVADKSKKMAEEYKVDYYTDYHKMLERSDIDVVCICTPSSMHPEQTIAAAKRGKHVITEKPMAIDLKSANKMINICKDKGVKLAVIFQRRVKPVFIRIKEALDKGELGKLVLGDIYLKYYRSPEYYASAGWRGTWKFDGGGALMNQGIHMIDFLLWCMGDVDTVYGRAETLLRKIEVEDTCVAVLKFKNGALGVLEGTTCVYPPTVPHRLELHGEKGSIMIEGEGIKRWEVMGPDDKPVSKIEKQEGVGKPMTSPTDIAMEGHVIQIQDVIDAIKEDREPSVPGTEGRRSLELILAIYESAKTGKPVKL